MDNTHLYLVKHPLGLILSFTLTMGHGQHMFSEKYFDCEVNSMRTEARTILVDYRDYDSLVFDLLKGVRPQTIRSISGDILIQLVVDEWGNPCCLSILNETKLSTKKLGLVGNVNAMKGWQNHSTDHRKICGVVWTVF